eukprot:CAMPEP_0119123362 /NCGR_PEP_ID=MMETSP1310-20130426/3324_1 /TAXON_ID=464262 /ORGANISM="Genus nov. species nov., Strain RCC2339" /LENGTH=528 /DNA_ID=CAMNT_0007113157 /DNA_START=76 /DNA_END=1659 /DNA_ORIENTATION=+
MADGDEVEIVEEGGDDGHVDEIFLEPAIEVQNPLLTKESSEDQLLVADKVLDTIRNLLSTIRAPPVGGKSGSQSGAQWEGPIFQHRRSPDRWVPRYLVIRNDGVIICKDMNQKKSGKGVEQLAYFRVKKIEHGDNFAQYQKDRRMDVNPLRLTLYSYRYTFFIATMSPAATVEIQKSLETCMKHKYEGKQLSMKAEAAVELEPLLVEQARIQRIHYELLVNQIRKAGLGNAGKKEKIKEGHLRLQCMDNGEVWEDYYFILGKTCLSYYKSKQRHLPVGSISLPFMSMIQTIPSKHKRRFEITTPLRQYALMARHSVAVNEWISVLVNQREVYRSRKRNSQAKKQRKEKTELGEATYNALEGEMEPSFVANVCVGEEAHTDDDEGDSEGKEERIVVPKDVDEPKQPWTGQNPPSIEVECEGKIIRKVLQPGNSVVVGRSSTCGLTISWDRKVSREHAKLVYDKETNTLSLLDLGTARGCLIEGKRTHMATVTVGCVIRIGQTDIFVRESTGSRIRDFFRSSTGSFGTSP